MAAAAGLQLSAPPPRVATTVITGRVSKVWATQAQWCASAILAMHSTWHRPPWTVPPAPFACPSVGTRARACAVTSDTMVSSILWTGAMTSHGH